MLRMKKEREKERERERNIEKRWKENKGETQIIFVRIATYQ